MLNYVNKVSDNIFVFRIILVLLVINEVQEIDNWISYRPEENRKLNKWEYFKLTIFFLLNWDLAF